MKLSEVKKSIVVALMKSVTTKNEKKAINVSKDVERQVEIVGKFLENKFLIECLTTAENCLNDPEKFDSFMKDFKPFNAKFSEQIEDG